MSLLNSDIASVYRQNVDQTTGKSEKALIGTVRGFLKAVSIQEVNQTNGAFWADMNFTCAQGSDIRVSDNIVVDGVEYSVKAVGKKHAMNLRLLVCKVTQTNLS